MSTASSTEITVQQGLPTAGTWTVDPAHSTLGFSVRHLVSKVRGHLDSFAATITINDPIETSVIEGSAQTASINTGSPDRDNHLRGADFFDAESNPQISFRSTALRRSGDTDWTVAGDLTMHGVTKPISLGVEFLGVTGDPWGNTRAAFGATATVNREDFGLNWNQALEAGGFLVGKDVKFEFDIEAIQQKS